MNQFEWIEHLQRLGQLGWFEQLGQLWLPKSFKLLDLLRFFRPL